jgi:hypothetical protein
MNAYFRPVLAGMLAAGYGVAVLFFLRFWAKSHDRLFAMFAWAFTILAVERLTVIAMHWTAYTTWMYLLRLLAFLVILAAIVDKNRPARRPER